MADWKAEIDADRARTLLARERSRAESGLADVRRVRGSENEELDSANDRFDEGTLLEEREVDEALERQLSEELEAIGRAEQRVDDGTYGISVESGDPIPAGRLEAIPWAERTAEEQERR